MFNREPENKQQGLEEKQPSPQVITTTSELVLAQVQKFYPDFSADKQIQLASIIKNVRELPTLLHSLISKPDPDWNITKEECDKYVEYMNAAKISEEELEALNLKAAKINNENKKMKYEQIIGLYNQAIKKYPSSSLLYLYRAQFSLYAFTIPQLDVKKDLEFATILYQCKLDKLSIFPKQFYKVYRNYLVFHDQIDASLSKHLNYCGSSITTEERLAADKEFLSTIKHLVELIHTKNVSYSLKLYNFAKDHFSSNAELKNIIAEIYELTYADKKLLAMHQNRSFKDKLYSRTISVGQLENFLQDLTMPLVEKVSDNSEDKKARQKLKQMENQKNQIQLCLQAEEEKQKFLANELEKERSSLEAERLAKIEKKKQEKLAKRAAKEKLAQEEARKQEEKKLMVLKKEAEKAVALAAKKAKKLEQKAKALKDEAEKAAKQVVALVINKTLESLTLKSESPESSSNPIQNTSNILLALKTPDSQKVIETTSEKLANESKNETQTVSPTHASKRIEYRSISAPPILSPIPIRPAQSNIAAILAHAAISENARVVQNEEDTQNGENTDSGLLQTCNIASTPTMSAHVNPQNFIILTPEQIQEYQAYVQFYQAQLAQQQQANYWLQLQQMQLYNQYCQQQLAQAITTNSMQILSNQPVVNQQPLSYEQFLNIQGLGYAGNQTLFSTSYVNAGSNINHVQQNNMNQNSYRY